MNTIKSGFHKLLAQHEAKFHREWCGNSGLTVAVHNIGPILLAGIRKALVPDMNAFDQEHDGITQIDRLKAGCSLLSFELRHDSWHLPCQGRVKGFWLNPSLLKVEEGRNCP